MNTLLLLLVVAMISSFGAKNIYDVDSMATASDFSVSEATELYNLENCTFDIYYLSLTTLSVRPMKLEDLENGRNDYHVVVDGGALTEHRELFDRLLTTELIPAERRFPIDARIYYVLKNHNNEEIFTFLFNGSDDVAIINGNDVEQNRIFYDVLIPFLPEDAAEDITKYILRHFE